MENDRDHSGLLLYLDRTALAAYRTQPAKYLVREDDMGGEVVSKDLAVSPIHVGFAHRRLVDGTVCLAVFAPDLERLQAEERAQWLLRRVPDPHFVQDDEPFERWCSRYVEGSWEPEDGPIVQIPLAMSRLCALTEYALGTPLWHWEEHELMSYPAAEDTESYRQAHLELHRLLIDGLRKESLSALASRLSISLTDEDKRLNSLKEVLPSQLVEIVHTPFKKCASQRNKKHGVPSSIAEFPAFRTFHGDLVEIESALRALETWLESVLGVKAEECLERKRALEVFFGRIVGPPKPEEKLDQLQLAVGKTIERIAFGEEAMEPDSHQAEAIEMHFTDGTAVSILVYSNATNLACESGDLKPSDFSTSLGVFWAPAVRRLEPAP